MRLADGDLKQILFCFEDGKFLISERKDMNPHAKADKNFIKTIDDFKELRDQIYLLEKSDGAVESPTVNWFENFRQEFTAKHIKYIDDFTTQGYIDATDKGLLTKAASNLKYTLTEALYEPLLKQNWSEVLGILRQITTATEQKEILPTLGCEVINHEEDWLTRCALMRDFVNHLRYDEQLDVPKEFALEYILFCIYNKDREGAKAELQLFNKNKRQLKTKKDFCIEHLFQAYHGLFLYLEWKEQKEYADELENQTDTEASFLLMSQDWTSKVQVTDIALKAINTFNGIERFEGTWDIFVDKYVELLVYTGRLPEAYTVLVDYSVHQTDSLNAQKYLYFFCVEHFPSRSDVIVEQLEVIAELNPSDPLVLEYCEAVGDSEYVSSSFELYCPKASNLKIRPSVCHSACKIVSCLFIMLDYPVWQSDIKPWKMLAHYLERIFVSRDEQTDAAVRSVGECWSVRESWWPAFHFNDYVAMNDSNYLELLREKYVINIVLIGHENSFAGLARQKLEEGGYSSQLEHIFNHHRPAS